LCKDNSLMKNDKIFYKFSKYLVLFIVYMSLAPPQAYTKTTIKKALSWLNEQQSDWSLYIKDINVAVRLYLKSHRQDKLKMKKNVFTEELKKIMYNSSCTPSEKTSPSLSFYEEKKDSLPLANRKELTSFFKEDFLDKRSQDLIHKTKDQLNMTCSEDVLRLLLQLGYQTLQQKLFP